MTASAQLSALVQCFFTQHLVEHKHVSPKTIAAYRELTEHNRVKLHLDGARVFHAAVAL